MICFALLAHKDELALLQQIYNLRKYNGPHIKIVIYNGGKNPNFGKQVCKKADVMYCPYSRPLQWGQIARFHFDVMRWLEEQKVQYDYLAILDHDVLFVNWGFETLLNKELNRYDFIGQVIRHETDPKKTTWIPGKTMWKEWYRWKPFFGRNDFYGTFNPLQVYRHRIVKRILGRINRSWLQRLLSSTKVFALEEILFITLAVRCGGKCKAYPKNVSQYLRVFPRIRLREVRDAKRKNEVLFVHPVKDAAVWNMICNS